MRRAQLEGSVAEALPINNSDESRNLQSRCGEALIFENAKTVAKG